MQPIIRREIRIMKEILEKNLNKNTIDLTGKRFSKLLVMEFAYKKQVIYENGRQRTTYYWKCMCDCGNEVIRSGNSLRNDYTKSCGCNKIYEKNLTNDRKTALHIKSNTNKIDLTGRVFSKLLVLGLDHKQQVTYKNGKKKTTYYWKCVCECGNEVIRSGESLRRGATKSCGCYKFYQQKLGQEKRKYLKSQWQGNSKEEIEEEFE
jgi:hypothetical protein